MTNLAANYVARRKLLGRYSQAQLAVEMYVATRTAERWCSGQITPRAGALERLEQLIAAFEKAETRRAKRRAAR